MPDRLFCIGFLCFFPKAIRQTDNVSTLAFKIFGVLCGYDWLAFPTYEFWILILFSAPESPPRVEIKCCKIYTLD